jgi:putative hydroxymethylpyrimidine transporter CytX
MYKKFAHSKYVGLTFLWFGAAISIAEITTGTLAAPLGVEQGILAILVGHILGCALLFSMAYLGSKTQRTAMNTVKLGFGYQGSKLFTILNILQLIGWSAVMLYQGGILLDSLRGTTFYITVILIAVGIIVWVQVTNKFTHLLNTITVLLLFLVCVGLSITIFTQGTYQPLEPNGITFSEVVELSAVMPISWLPLIADYTSKVTAPVKAAFLSTGAYFVSGCWMYIIGLSSALFIGATDPNTAISIILHALPFGAIPVFIGAFSTIVTTYLDANSSGESFASLFKDEKVKKHVSTVGTCVIVFAMFIAIAASDDFITVYEQFLYFIGAVFAPLAAVLVTNYFVSKTSSENTQYNIKNLLCWLFGFALYQALTMLNISTPLGISIPVVIATATLNCIFTLVTTSRRPR